MKEKVQADIIENEVLIFFAWIFCMGVVKLPSRDSYWSTVSVYPTRKLCKKMTGNRFRYLLRYIHMAAEERTYAEISDDEDETQNVWDTLSIDDVMVKFEGRSAETHRLKNNPVSQGYKIFSLADSQSGFICSFTPDGRV